MYAECMSIAQAVVAAPVLESAFKNNLEVFAGMLETSELRASTLWLSKSVTRRPKPEPFGEHQISSLQAIEVRFMPVTPILVAVPDPSLWKIDQVPLDESAAS